MIIKGLPPPAYSGSGRNSPLSTPFLPSLTGSKTAPIHALEYAQYTSQMISIIYNSEVHFKWHDVIPSRHVGTYVTSS